MAMFICMMRNRWVMGRCEQCHKNCGLGHPHTQEHGTRLWGAGFDKREPAKGKGLVAIGENPE